MWKREKVDFPRDYSLILWPVPYDVICTSHEQVSVMSIGKSWGGSNKHSQSMFGPKNKKYIADYEL